MEGGDRSGKASEKWHFRCHMKVEESAIQSTERKIFQEERIAGLS